MSFIQSLLHMEGLRLTGHYFKELSRMLGNRSIRVLLTDLFNLCHGDWLQSEKLRAGTLNIDCLIYIFNSSCILEHLVEIFVF